MIKRRKTLVPKRNPKRLWRDTIRLDWPRGLSSVEHFFTADELRQAHPEPKWAIYHNIEHSLLTYLMAFELTEAFHIEGKEKNLLLQLALLHDWDPNRRVGVPARVSVTIRSLACDFIKKDPLCRQNKNERSILQDRFCWTRRELLLAFAFIYRTEFPFTEKHDHSFYLLSSPVERYRTVLRLLDPQDQRFVIFYAPLFAQYADQASWYTTQDFSNALLAVEGLVNEINLSNDPNATTRELNTTGFLYSIESDDSFAIDLAIAKEFGIDLQLPSLDAYFALLPDKYRNVFFANQAAFHAYDQALANEESEKEASNKGLNAYQKAMRE